MLPMLGAAATKPRSPPSPSTSPSSPPVSAASASKAASATLQAAPQTRGTSQQQAASAIDADRGRVTTPSPSGNASTPSAAPPTTIPSSPQSPTNPQPSFLSQWVSRVVSAARSHVTNGNMRPRQQRLLTWALQQTVHIANVRPSGRSRSASGGGSRGKTAARGSNRSRDASQGGGQSKVNHVSFRRPTSSSSRSGSTRPGLNWRSCW